jgi:F0F1-type ATP synthase membrane subunit b/b'
MAKSLITIAKETGRKIKEARSNLEDIARIGDQCLEANKNELIKNLKDKTSDNLRVIPSYLSKLSKSREYKEDYEHLLNDFRDLVRDYLFLKREYSL